MMPSNTSGRRKSSRAVRTHKKSTTSNTNNVQSSPTSEVEPTSSNVTIKPSKGSTGTQKQKSNAQAGNEMVLMQKDGATPNKPNVFEFLQEGDSSDDSDSDHEGPEAALADVSQPSRDGTRDRSSSYIMSPESSFRASSPEQTFSVTSRESAATDAESMTSPDASPATAYLDLVNKHNLQKIAQAQRRHDGVHRQIHNQHTDDDDDEQSDYPVPEDYYSTEQMHYHHYQQHLQSSRFAQQQKHNRDRKKSKRRNTSSLPSEEGQLISTQTEKPDSNKLKSRDAAEPKLSSGYALLASKLDSSISKPEHRRLVPVYRRFENVNHRILLYLQDEISHLEEELQKMDEYEARHRMAVAEKNEIEHLEPSSRRMDVEAGKYSAFHAQRLELVDRLTYKIHQYNDALTSYTKMRQILPKASPKDIQTYRTWMNENTPITKAETGFLDHDLDLVSLNSVVRINAGDNNILYFIIGVMSAALLLPLLAY